MLNAAIIPSNDGDSQSDGPTDVGRMTDCSQRIGFWRITQYEIAEIVFLSTVHRYVISDLVEKWLAWRVRWIPLVPIVAAAFWLAAYIVPVALSSGSERSEEGIHSPLKLGITPLNVTILIVSGGIYASAGFLRSVVDRRMAGSMASSFDSTMADITNDFSQHNGTFRIAIVAVAVSVLIVLFVGGTQEEALWWKRPAVHAPLAVIGMSISVFAAAFAVLRTMHVGRVISRLIDSSPPAARQKSADAEDFYSAATLHYGFSAGLAVFAALHLGVLFLLQDREWGTQNDAARVSNLWVTIGAVVIYFLLVLFVLLLPMIRQWRTLRCWRRHFVSTLNWAEDNTARQIEKTSRDIGEVNDQARNLVNIATSRTLLESRRPVWPVPIAKMRAVYAVATLVAPLAFKLRDFIGQNSGSVG